MPIVDEIDLEVGDYILATNVFGGRIDGVLMDDVKLGIPSTVRINVGHNSVVTINTNLWDVALIAR